MTGKQIEALRDALCSAFNQETLDEMLRLRLDKSRLELAGSGNLRTVVFSVIEAAVREGWHAELIRAAISYNSGNSALRRFCEEYPELMVTRGDSMAAVAVIPDDLGRRAKRQAEQSTAFGEDRRKAYKEMWERVERLSVEGAIQEIPETEFSRRIAEINAFLSTWNVYIDDADLTLVNSYARAARAFHVAVRDFGDPKERLAAGYTIAFEQVQEMKSVAETQEEALKIACLSAGQSPDGVVGTKRVAPSHPLHLVARLSPPGRGSRFPGCRPTSPGPVCRP
jgi:hypothetical protein